MTFPSQSQIDVIATQILLDAKQALLSLKAWNNSIADAQGRMKLFKELIKATAQQMNGDLKAASAAVQKFAKSLNINPELVKKIGKDLQLIDKIAQKSLGGMSQKSMEANARISLLSNAIQAMATKGKISIDQVVSSLRTLNASSGSRFGKLGFSDQNIIQAGQAAQQTATQIQKVGTASTQAGQQTEGAFKRVFTAVNAERIALGALISMLLFQFIQAVSTTFKTAIEQAAKFEDTLYRLKNAERALSMEGVEISLKGLKKGIEDIQNLFPIFSKEDVASLVGTLAVSTKQLRLNEQQILDLAKAIAVLNIRSEKSEDIQTTAQHVLSSLLTGNAKGISALGIAFTENTMKAEAMKQGFLEADEAVADLTENEKGLVKLALLLQSTGQEMGAIGEYLDTNSAKLQENKAAWNDLLTTLGQILLPFIPALTGFFQLINDGFNMFKVVLIEAITVTAAFGTALFLLFTRQISSFDDWQNAVVTAVKAYREELTNAFFKEVPEGAPEFFKRGWGDLIRKDAETATNALGDMYDAAADDEEAQKALAELDDKIKDIILDAKQAQEDLDIRLAQKEEDLDTEYIRKAEDAAIDHQDKLEDINQDALDKIEDAKRKAREREQEAEQDLLQKLKELRERFLLDLEDALHARDARAVLRLIKEYKLEKQNILDRAALEAQQRKERLAEELRQIEIERQRRIESENIEYQRKLADLATAKAREQEELALWYKREQEDIQRNIEQKLEKLLAGYINEEKLHEEHQGKIYAILAKYFGKDMELMSHLTAFMAQQWAQLQTITSAAYQVGNLGGGIGGGGYTQVLNTGGGRTGGGGGRRMAEGGSILATRPTTAIFGERGPELATFTPLGRSGVNAGQMFGGGGLNGQITVSVLLSPDLEGRIVEKSMDGVADMVAKVNNTKVR